MPTVMRHYSQSIPLHVAWLRFTVTLDRPVSRPVANQFHPRWVSKAAGECNLRERGPQARIRTITPSQPPALQTLLAQLKREAAPSPQGCRTKPARICKSSS